VIEEVTEIHIKLSSPNKVSDLSDVYEYIKNILTQEANGKFHKRTSHWRQKNYDSNQNQKPKSIHSEL
jgi:hypothetical protein